MNTSLETVFKNCAVAPINSVTMDDKMNLKVTFLDGRSFLRKFDENLYQFISIIKDVPCERIHHIDLSAIPSKLGYYELLGFRKGETAVYFIDGWKFVIQFLKH